MSWISKHLLWIGLPCRCIVVNFVIIFRKTFLLKTLGQIMHRSSRPDVFCKKSVLRSFAKFLGKYLSRVSFLLKKSMFYQPWTCSLYFFKNAKSEVDFCKFSLEKLSWNNSKFTRKHQFHVSFIKAARLLSQRGAHSEPRVTVTNRGVFRTLDESHRQGRIQNPGWLSQTRAYSEPCRTIFAKISILDVWQGSG